MSPLEQELIKRHLVLVALLNDTEGLGEVMQARRDVWFAELAAVRAILRERYGHANLPTETVW